MPDLTIETRYTCPSNISWAKEVPGSKGNKYIVSFHCDGLVQWHCTCPGYKFHHTCKHIDQVEKERCGWGWEAFCGDYMTPKDGPTGKVCPECGEPVSVISVGV